MVWGKTRGVFGTCGNFKFEIYTLTDVKATRSLVKPMMNNVYMAASTNVTDNTDVFAAQPLNWTGQVDGNTTDKLDDGSEVFDPDINGAQATNITDGRTSFVTYDKDTASQLFCHKGGMADAVYDLCPDGNENYVIRNQRIIQLVAGNASDDGTLLVLGV